MVTRRFLPALALAILVPAPSPAGNAEGFPQSSTGEIRGTLRDAAGAAVTVAVVTVRNDESGWSTEATVDAKGEFVLRPTPAGTYRLEAMSPGFQKYAQGGIRLGAGKTVTIAARLQAGGARGTLATLGGGHVVLGYGWNDYGYGSWSHTFAVLVTPHGRILGRATVSLFEPETPDTPELDLHYTNDVECFELDPATHTAWLGGRISETNRPDFIALGTYVVTFARDGGRGGNGDFHGDALPGLWGQEETCHTRPDPLFMDPVQRGDIVVR